LSKAASPTRRLSDGQGREAKSGFVGGVQGSSAVLLTSIAEVNCVQGCGSGHLRLRAHHTSMLHAWLGAPSLLRLLCSALLA